MVKTVLYNASIEAIRSELVKSGTILKSCFVQGFRDLTQSGDTWPRYEFVDTNSEFFAVLGVVEEDGTNGEIIAEFDKKEDALKVAEELIK